MKRYALALTALTILIVPTQAQFDGPPNRDYNNPEYRRPVPLPQPRRYGPQVGPCIFEGDCRGRRYRDGEGPYPMPPFRHPRMWGD